MKQLAAITEFLVGLDLVAAEQIESWVENPRIVPSATIKSSTGGLVIYQQTYTAVIAIERFPHKTIPVERLFAHVSAWLIDNDNPDRFDHEDARIETDVEIMDDETADIEISIDFIEEVEIFKRPGGPIRLNGEDWDLEPVEIYYAEEGELAGEELVL